MWNIPSRFSCRHFLINLFFILFSDGELPKAKYPDNPELGEIPF